MGEKKSKKKAKKKPATFVGKAKEFGKGLVEEFGKHPRKPPIGGRRVKKI